MGGAANIAVRMLADAEVLNSRLSKLEGAGDLGTHIVNVVKNKAVTPSRNSGDTSKTAVITTLDATQPGNDDANGAADSQSRTSSDRAEKAS